MSLTLEVTGRNNIFWKRLNVCKMLGQAKTDLREALSESESWNHNCKLWNPTTKEKGVVRPVRSILYVHKFAFCSIKLNCSSRGEQKVAHARIQIHSYKILIHLSKSIETIQSAYIFNCLTTRQTQKKKSSNQMAMCVFVCGWVCLYTFCMF